MGSCSTANRLIGERLLCRGVKVKVAFLSDMCVGDLVWFFPLYRTFLSFLRAWVAGCDIHTDNWEEGWVGKETSSNRSKAFLVLRLTACFNRWRGSCF